MATRRRRRVSIRRAGEELRARIGVTASSAIDTVWSRIRDLTLQEYERLERRGLDAEEIADALEVFIADLSRAAVANTARASSRVSYNQGRRFGQIAGVDEAERVVRSEILDTGTCDPCRTIDGTIVTVGSELWERLHPPALCEGEDLCRGVYLPIVEGLT